MSCLASNIGIQFISSSTTLAPNGFKCLNNTTDDYFSKKVTTSNSNGSINFINLEWESQGGGGNYYKLEKRLHYIDKYGIIWYYYINSLAVSDMARSSFTCPSYPCCPEGGRKSTTFKSLTKEPLIPLINIPDDVKKYVYSEPACSRTYKGYGGTPNGCDGIISESDTNCDYVYPYTTASASTSANSCAFAFGQLDGCENVFGAFGESATCQSEIKTEIILEEIITKEIMYEIAVDSNNKKISRLESNLPQDRSDTVCGEGGKKDCWSSVIGISEAIPDQIIRPVNYYAISPTDSTALSQKWIIKPIIKKDELKNILKFKGKIFIYTEGEAEASSPCCNACGCFDGNIVYEKDFSIIYKESSNSEYIESGEIISFDNSKYTDVSKNLYYCILSE